MMSTSTQKLNWLALTIATAAIAGGTIFCPAIAQNNEPIEITRVKLDIDGPDQEWIRIEQSGNVVRLVHTTRSDRQNGAGGVANFVLDGVGAGSLLSFSDWDDHQTIRILFEPDYCSDRPANQSASQSQTADATSPLRPPSERSGCTVTGTDTLVLPQGTDIRQGQFTLDYIERNLLRSITFRVSPENE